MTITIRDAEENETVINEYHFEIVVEDKDNEESEETQAAEINVQEVIA